MCTAATTGRPQAPVTTPVGTAATPGRSQAPQHYQVEQQQQQGVLRHQPQHQEICTAALSEHCINKHNSQESYQFRSLQYIAQQFDLFLVLSNHCFIHLMPNKFVYI